MVRRPRLAEISSRCRCIASASALGSASAAPTPRAGPISVSHRLPFHVAEGGQARAAAIVGNVNAPTEGVWARKKRRINPTQSKSYYAQGLSLSFRHDQHVLG
jgi:hypothetical protein